MIHSVSWDELRSAELPAGVPDSHSIPRDASVALPDAQYITADTHGRVRGRCAVWCGDIPPLTGEVPGIIGHYAASDETSARELLGAACSELRKRGCTLAIGPMNGNTWQQYRLVTGPGTDAPFFLEPFNPPEWPCHFATSGFAEIARYFSALNSDLTQRDARADSRAAALSDIGITMRDLDVNNLDFEIQRIHTVSLASFQQNLLYTPIPLHVFAAQYTRLRGYLDPRLVTIAEHGGRAVGFAFAIPDLLERQAAGIERTVIIKTVAILPEREIYSGLGSILVARTHKRAHELGFSRAIHALIHESNHSRAVSARTAQVMRRYALFARRLDTSTPRDHHVITT